MGRFQRRWGPVNPSDLDAELALIRSKPGYRKLRPQQRVVLADIPGKNRREKKAHIKAMQKAWLHAKRLERAG